MDFEYILVDNGSTDGTGKIIDEYAAKDPRIRVFRTPENYRGMRYHLFLDNMRGQYFAALDSDDWLEPDFLSQLYRRCEEDDLDMCVCGSRYRLESDGTEGVLRVPSAELTFAHEETPRYFPRIHVYLRTTWAKLIRADAIRRADLSLLEQFVRRQLNGSDTAFSVSVFDRCRRVGMQSCCLHHWRIRKDSVLHEYDAGRYGAYEQLYDQTIRVLSGFGPLSPENRTFTSLVFFNALVDTLSICIGSRLSDREKVTEIAEILGKPRVMEVRKTESGGEGRRMLMPYIKWVLNKKRGMSVPGESMKKILTFLQPAFFGTLGREEWDVLLNHFRIPANMIEGNYRLAYEDLCRLTGEHPEAGVPAAERFCLDNLAETGAERLHYLLETAKAQPARRAVLMGYAARLMRQNKLLATLRCGDAVLAFSDVAEAVYQADCRRAVDLASRRLQDRDFRQRLPLARLMKPVAAVANDPAAFVYFSKVYAAELLAADLTVEAAKELRELQEMLPQDPDVRALLSYLPPSGKKRE